MPSPISHPKDRKSNELTERELQVVAILATGATRFEIAQDLHCSPETVKTHTKHILDKLGFDNRVQITAWWVARELSKL